MQAEANTRESVPILGRIVDVRPDEVRAMLLSCAYFFFVLSSYYIIRPIRDEMGAAGGVDNLPWLFTGTLVGMLLAQPLFGKLVSKYPRRVFIPTTYRFFMANLLVFFILLRVLDPSQQIWVGRVFFIWAAVYNLFVVSVFWAFMVDVFRNEQSKRLFGFIGVGGTIGGIMGAGLTAALASPLGPINLLLISILFLEVAVQCARRLGGMVRNPSTEPEPKARGNPELAIGGGMWAGVTHVMKSPYMLGIVLHMLFFTIGSTFLYFFQAEIVNATYTDRGVRTAFFAKIDLLVNVLTLLTQAAFFGRLMKWIGVGATLALLPAVSVAGFLLLGLTPTVGVFVLFYVLRRAGNYAIARPAREVLFTVLPREDRYKAKSFIDTFVYRFGDQVGAWSFPLMGMLGLGMAGIAFVGAPMSAVWLFVALWLGRRQVQLKRQNDLEDERAVRHAALVP